MFIPHKSRELNDLFAQKPYQGVELEKAMFLFVGLDANYGEKIADHAIFPSILDYHANGVSFWRDKKVHHPFLLPGYTDDGWFYHNSFADIGFGPKHAHLVSFIELLHVPTVGRENDLVPSDFSAAHLKRLNAAIVEGPARYIFIPKTVARLMRASGYFKWLPARPVIRDTLPDVWWTSGDKTVYSHLHFSNFGKFEERKTAEALAIRRLIALHDERHLAG